MVPGLLPACWYIVLSQFLAAHGRPRAALVAVLVAIAVNAVGNYALMFGHFGLPELGLVGCGIATLVVDCLLFALLLGFVSCDRRLRRYRILARIWRPDWARFRELFRIGLPIGLTMLSQIGLYLGSSLLIGRFGADQLAAHGLAIECIALAYMIPFGIAQAATVRVGLARGRDDPAGVRLAGWSAIGWGWALCLPPALAFWLLAREVVSLFLDPGVAANAAAVAFAVSFLEIAALCQLVDTAQVIASGALRGLKDTRVPMLIAVVGYWVLGLGAAAYFAFGLGLEGRGAWIGLGIGLAAVAPVMVLRFRALAARV
jgi:MATE family multidrug resistance protein